MDGGVPVRRPGEGYCIEDLAVGMEASYAKTITDADLVLFAGVSGDTNPVHIDAEFAARTPFKGRIAHGILTASLISTVLGTRLPGPGVIYLNQNLTFRGPVYPGDTVVATVILREVLFDKRRVLADTTCRVGDRVVVEGSAKLLVPSRERGGAGESRES